MFGLDQRCNPRHGIDHRISALRVFLALAVVGSLQLTAACTSGSSDAPKTPATTVVGSNLDGTRQPPAPPIEGAKPGGTVTVLTAQTLPSLDPTENYYPQTASIMSGLVNRSLTQWVYDPDRGDMVLIPDIATDLGTPNEDYTQWTFTIRDGVRFEDGTPVTVKDMVYGIERSFDRTAFKQGPPYSHDYFLHGDTYEGPYRDGTDYDGITVDGNKLTIRMAKPFPDMPYWGALPAMGPIPEDGSNPSTYGLHPLATGPYKFAAYRPGKSLSLVRNPEWNPATDPGRHQYPDGYRFLLQHNADDLTTRLLADSQPDKAALTFDTPAPEYVQSAMDEAPARLVTGPTSCTFFMALDYRKIPDLRVRQALGYAFPYEQFARAADFLPGITATPGRTLLPPGTPGHLDYNPLTTAPGQTDTEKSKELLAQAGYAPGEFTLTIPFNKNDPSTVALFDALTTGLEAGGFRVKELAATSQGQLTAIKLDGQSPANVQLNGWCLDWPSGSSSIVRQLSTSSSDKTRLGTFFDEPSVDHEVERIATLPADQQLAAWGALDRRIETAYYPMVVTLRLRDAMLHGSLIGGMENDAELGMPTWKDLYVRS